MNKKGTYITASAKFAKHEYSLSRVLFRLRDDDHLSTTAVACSL